MSTSQLKSAIANEMDNEKVSKLLEKMDIKAVNRKEKGETALHVACQNKNQEALDLLLARTGIDVNVKDYYGLTPLHEAIIYDNLQAAAKMLDRPDIDVTAKSRCGSTPLHFACRYNLHSIVRKLLASPGIDVNATDDYGNTPIIDSARLCKKEALNVMLGGPRVNLDTKDNEGKGLEEIVGASGNCSKEGKDTGLEMIKKERMRRENGKIGQEQTNKAGSIERGIVRIEKINKEIVMEEERNNKNVDMRKKKMENLVEKQTLDRKILAKKHEEESSLLEENQRHEITVLQDTSAREDHNEQRYIASLKEHRDELAQEIENAGNDASSQERSKLERITRSLECPVCMELMKPPMKICMCLFTHVICEACKDLLKAKGKNCPTCTTEPFTGRNYMAEDFARTVFNE